MENNDQNSQENKTPGNQHSQHGGPHDGGQCRRSDYRDCTRRKNQGWMKKQSTKTSAIALGILVAFSLALIGFDTTINRDVNSEKLTEKNHKSLLILSHERENDGPGLIASNVSTWNDKESNETNALRETNRIQSNKIKSLNRRLTDANQKLHEVKAHLFTKGDPSDRARLAEVCQELVQKERVNQEFSEKLARLENEKEQNTLKIKRMEQTIDALATMTDTQRETKEQAVLNFQDQLDRLQANARDERAELEKNIQDLKESQQQLKESIAEKLATINSLESEVSWQYSLLHEKDQEIKSEAQLYNASESALNKKLQDLIAALELEELKNERLTNEVEIAKAKQGAKQQYAKSLEEKLEKNEQKAKSSIEEYQKTQISLANEYLDLQGLLGVYANSHKNFSTKQKKLSTLVSEEKNRADKLQRELEKALASVDSEQQRGLCIEDELHHMAQKVVALNEELKAQGNLLENKKQELETQTYSSASLKDQLNERINQLTMSLEEEQNKVADKEIAIRDLSINLELGRNHLKELVQQLNEAQAVAEQQTYRSTQLEDQRNEKAEILAALEDRLQDKQREVNELTMQVNSINTNLENKATTIDEMQSYLDELKQELATEKRNNEELQHSLSTTIAGKNSQQSQVAKLEEELNSQISKVISLQGTLADKQQKIQSLMDTVQNVSDELEQEKAHAKTLHSDLNDTLTKHDTEYTKAKTLEHTLEDSEKQIAGLLDQMDEISYRYESEKSRSSELEKNLLKVISKLDEKEHTLDQILEDNKISQEEFGTLKHEIQRLRQERDQLLMQAKEQQAIIENKISTQEDLNGLQRELNALYQEKQNLERKNAQQIKLILQQQEIVRKITGNVQEQQEAMRLTENTNQLLQKETGSPPINVEESQNPEHLKEENSTTQKGAKAAKGITHIIKPGESLSTISVYYYGSPNRWIDIFNANRKILKNKNDKLTPGTELWIPK